MNELNDKTYLTGCKNKVAYTTKKQAVRSKDKVLSSDLKNMKKMKMEKPKFNVYHCLHCGHWHFGNKRK